LTCDGKAFFTSGFVVLNEVILGLNEFVEFLTQLGLDGTAEGTEAEAMTGARGGVGILVGTNGEGSIPAGGRRSATCRRQAKGHGMSLQVSERRVLVRRLAGIAASHGDVPEHGIPG
jgi:hypothetical protein